MSTTGSWWCIGYCWSGHGWWSTSIAFRWFTAPAERYDTDNALLQKNLGRTAYIFLHELILIPCFSCSHRGQEKGVIHAVSPLYFSFQRVTITVQESMEEIHWTLHICPRVCDEQSCVFWWNTSHRLSSRHHTLLHTMSLKLVSIRGIFLFRFTDT